jgi:succinyl-diaminopimelate desuccinylase
VNAIHELVRGLESVVRMEPIDVELDGLVYREVVSAVRIEGGIASNVIPARASVELNMRYMLGDAEKPLRWLLKHGEVEILSNSPSAHPSLGHPQIQRLLALVPDVAPKQAWTPVAQFAEQGIPAINYGPGETRYAHRQDEQVPIANLERAYETLRAFLT